MFQVVVRSNNHTLHFRFVHHSLKGKHLCDKSSLWQPQLLSPQSLLRLLQTQVCSIASKNEAHAARTHAASQLLPAVLLPLLAVVLLSQHAVHQLQPAALLSQYAASQNHAVIPARRSRSVACERWRESNVVQPAARIHAANQLHHAVLQPLQAAVLQQCQLPHHAVVAKRQEPVGRSVASQLLLTGD